MREIYRRIFAFPGGKLSRRFLLLCLIAFAIQIMIIVHSYVDNYAERCEDALQNNELALQQANENYLNSLIDNIDNSILQVYYDRFIWQESLGEEDAYPQVSEWHNLLSNIYRLNQNIQSVYMYSQRENRLYLLDGISYADLPINTHYSNSFYIENPDTADYPWLTNAEALRGTLYAAKGTAIRSASSSGKETVYSFARALVNPLNSAQTLYVLCINIKQQVFSELTRQLCGDGEAFMLISQDGQTVYDNLGARRDTASEIARKARGMLDAGQMNMETQIGSKQYLILATKANKAGWSMVKGILTRDLRQESVETLIRNILSVSLVYLLSIALILYVSRYFFRPVTELAAIMEQYEKMKNRLPGYSARKDEVGQLYRSFIVMRDRLDAMIKREYVARLRENQARIEALQAQINPHFLNNTLQTIAGLAIDKDIPEIEHIVIALSGMLRYSLTSRALVPVQQELKIVEQYLFIQKFRFKDRIQLTVALPESVMDRMIPVFALQLAVENAVKHGLERKVGGGNIWIRYEKDSPDSYCILVEDDGIGIDEEKLRSMTRRLEEDANGPEGDGDWTGKGLINMHERIRCHYGEQFGIKLKARPEGGFIVAIRLPEAST